MDNDHQSAGTCTNCGSADLHLSNVRSAFWQDDRLVVVEDIPALVCRTCGEQFYDDETVVALDLLRGAGFPPERARAEVRALVFSYRETGALRDKS
ncbi:MAG TPA: type II toxin-antitoxin system MqsA family antitoxin [Burkholderiaceae bacterium]|nr:type II toxin-antitoxin system MqsA family antitoxin [Burkholderiaceae bacterium]